MLDGTEERYDPRTFEGLKFEKARRAMADGSDTPRAYLERCLETVEAREPVVQAFSAMNAESARAAADASTERWAKGAPLSPIDGMPVGIKDLLETKDMPTQMGCEAFSGAFPKRDNAAVRALRQAGAVIFGKTVTAELGGTHPGPTTNPFDPERTPGGSSSGSAAAVAARMMPAAIGSQVGGSIIRPSGFCGNYALKPSQGAIHRGERMMTSMSTHGPHAACIEDMWQVAIEIARRTGGDPGRAALSGPDTPPEPHKPARLIVLETAGWSMIDDATKTAFETLCQRLQDADVALIRRADHGGVEDLEQAVSGAADICNHITSWENRWFLRNLIDENADGVSPRAHGMLERAEGMSPDDYQVMLGRRERAQAVHRWLAGLADAAITLSCPGPAPFWRGDVPGEPLAARPTGDAVFNYPSSMLFAPVVSVPMMGIGGLPVGMQVMGQYQSDARVTAIARWISETIEPYSDA